MMENATIEFWHWWIFAAVLLVVESFATGTFFLWMGVASVAVGFLLLLIPDLRWEYQFLIFSALSVASIVTWRMYLRRNPTATDRPTLNRRGEQYVGRTFTLTEPIVNGNGKIRVDDSIWKIEGADVPAGQRVRVVGVDGTILKIEAAD